MTPEALLNAMPIALVLIGRDSMIRHVNPPAEHLFGEQASGRHYISVLRQPALLDQIETVMRTRASGKVRYLGSEVGRDLVFEVTITALQAPDEGVLLAFEDVTPFEEARQMRSDFVANVSHELRSPLTALTGFIETLQGPAAEDSDARAQFLDIMAREAGRMNRLIHDLLSLSRVEDQARLRPTDTVELCSLIHDTVDTLKRAAKNRSVRLVTTDCGGQEPVLGDADQLRQVLTNLIENAVKYGREGGTVTVSMKREDYLAPLRGPGVIVAVTDEGEGISHRHLGRLTERFYRADRHRARDMGGTGLGLAIVKHIVNRHRGRLRITSVVGQGSTFSVMLPVS